MLYTSINLSINAFNINSENNSYHCFAYGTGLNPPNSDIADGAKQTILGTIDVPDAFVGSEGTYNLQRTGYDFFVLPNGQRSTALLPGTVTYVTEETEIETITEQTIEFIPATQVNVIPLTFDDCYFEEKEQTVTFYVVLDAGDGGAKRGSGSGMEAAAPKKPLTIKRTMKKQREQASASAKA
ncbi:hypothetical protein BDZ85DRAFT_245875 [Elsinoe ampelina]|uniref:Uncharacterized protein n=1 Tax=Elsinoe ampelina TaxID=302913 RepID=A0A6A6GNH1_9PEZI|nr:hypothetical protein BDZ85DRAFT_245875 [Elsinoe ampelina]